MSMKNSNGTSWDRTRVTHSTGIYMSMKFCSRKGLFYDKSVEFHDVCLCRVSKGVR